MNTKSFLQLSKRNIFHVFVKSNDKSDPKYIPNYPPSVIVEFNDDKLYIRDFNNNKLLLSIDYDEILTFNMSVCSRLGQTKIILNKLYHIEFIIITDKLELHFESKDSSIWKYILPVLEAHQVKIVDPLNVFENLLNCVENEDFYNLCENNISIWKEKHNILDPKYGDLIK